MSYDWADEAPEYIYRLRRKSDGMYFGQRGWGPFKGPQGKMYATLGAATGAQKNSNDPEVKDAEIVEFELEQTRVIKTEKKQKKSDQVLERYLETAGQ